jgi:hypothetical protein
MNALTRITTLALIFGTFLMSGCITQTALPSYARSGDMVQIGLGGIKRNATNKSLTFSDLTVTITDSLNVTQPIQPIGVFRAYPDHTSWYARDALDRADGFFGTGATEPYDGMWWTSIRLIWNDTPITIATGPATVTITSAELTDTGGGFEGTLASFPLEIIAGVSNPSQNTLRQYQAYQHQRSLTITPDDLTGVTVVGGFQVALTYNTAAVAVGTPLIHPRVVPYSHDPNISIIQNTVDNGDGTQTLTAIVTNPNGFVPSSDIATSWAIGTSIFRDLDFAVVVRDATILAGWQTNYSIDAVDSYYIDDTGAVIANLNPVLGVSY